MTEKSDRIEQTCQDIRRKMDAIEGNVKEGNVKEGVLPEVENSVLATLEHFAEQIGDLAEWVKVESDGIADTSLQDRQPEHCHECGNYHVDELENVAGMCPRCGYEDGYFNVDSESWCVCKHCRVVWCIGSLFSSHLDETEEEQKAIYSKFKDFEEVRPCLCSEIAKQLRERVDRPIPKHFLLEHDEPKRNEPITF